MPVARAQWRTVLEDGDLPGRWARLQDRLATVVVLCGTSRSIGRRLPHCATELVDFVRDLHDSARQTLWFQPPQPAGMEVAAIHRLVRAAADATCALLDTLSGVGSVTGGVDALAQSLEEGDKAASAVAAASSVEASQGHDVVAAAFGVAGDELVGDRQIRTAARLYALWDGSPEELDALGRRLLGHLLPERFDYVLDPTCGVASLLACPRPLVAHRAALWTRDLISRSYAQHPDACVEGIAGTMRRAQQGWSSHLGIADASRAIRTSVNDSETLLRRSAERYRVIIEGPLRQTGIAVLRMLGDTPTRMTTITELAERLASHRDQRLCVLLASVINPAWRNPAAHEEFH